jgi:hypothetical protein
MFLNAIFVDKVWVPMTLTPADMLNIQSAIDRYERRFPNRPPPSAEEALKWQEGL